MKDWAEKKGITWDGNHESYGDYLINVAEQYAEVIDSIDAYFPDWDYVMDKYHNTTYVIAIA